MELTIQRRNDIDIISFNGNLDGNTAPGAQEKIIPYLVPGCLLVFDMEKCPTISSAGLRLLLMLAKQIMKIGGKGALTGLSEEIKEVMQMTGFENIFISFETVGEAIEFLKGKGT
ncbi:MAG: hypothetical protein AMS17_14370 [Spirochaetes bacterium DG_61]|nr:MAG: hypothetical protein AMS17_14370 [Spirochaetes bacterium DG_61]